MLKEFKKKQIVGKAVRDGKGGKVQVKNKRGETINVYEDSIPDLVKEGTLAEGTTPINTTSDVKSSSFTPNKGSSYISDPKDLSKYDPKSIQRDSATKRMYGVLRKTSSGAGSPAAVKSSPSVSSTTAITPPASSSEPSAVSALPKSSRFNQSTRPMSKAGGFIKAYPGQPGLSVRKVANPNAKYSNLKPKYPTKKSILFNKLGKSTAADAAMKANSENPVFFNKL